jgi:hypothetical protein
MSLTFASISFDPPTNNETVFFPISPDYIAISTSNAVELAIILREAKEDKDFIQVQETPKTDWWMLLSIGLAGLALGLFL